MTKSSWIAAALTFAVVLAVWGIKQRFFPTWPITNANPRGATIVALGDSITDGYSVTRDKTYVALLAKEFRIPIINAGITGDTTEGGLKRLDRDVLSRNPKVVLVELGGNDLLHQTPRSQTRANIEEIVTRIQAAGAAVVLVTVDGPPGFGGLNALYREIAQARGAVFVPNVIRGLLTNPKMMSDQFHPNEKGHEIIAQRVAKVLRKSLPAVFP